MAGNVPPHIVLISFSDIIFRHIYRNYTKELPEEEYLYLLPNWGD